MLSAIYRRPALPASRTLRNAPARRSGRALALTLVLAALMLSGCSVVLPEAAREYKELKAKVFNRGPQAPNDQRLADLGYKAILENRLGEAETRLNSALAINPHNPYALLNLGVVYQTTGRYAEARKLYRKVIALNPDARAISATRKNHVGLGLAEIARANLAQIAAETAAPTPPPPDAQAVERARLQRFAALARLRAEGFLSDAEYQARRKANLGALLPLTAPAPSPLVSLPAPPVDDIVARLREIAGFREKGALAEADYAIERAAILDGLMPLRPGEGAENAAVSPATFPADGKAALARIARLRARNYITEDEYQAERAELARRLARLTGGQSRPAQKAESDAPAPVVDGAPAPNRKPPLRRLARAEAAVQTDGTVAPAASASASAPAAAPPARAAAVAPNAGKSVGVHVASFRTPERARRGWEEIRAANGDLLAALGPHIARVDLGGDKGVFFQLRIGPLASRADAARLCDQLKRRKLYCAPTAF